MMLAQKIGVLMQKSDATVQEGVVHAPPSPNVKGVNNIKVINFNTPNCGWSQKLQPVWDKLTELYKDNPDIDIIDMKCDQHPQVCAHFSIEGYPTIKKFKPTNNGTAQMFEYNGDRTLESLAQFAKE